MPSGDTACKGLAERDWEPCALLRCSGAGPLGQTGLLGLASQNSAAPGGFVLLRTTPKTGLESGLQERRNRPPKRW